MTNLFTIAVLSVIFVGQALAETITFGIYTSDKPTVMYQKFKPIIDYLQKCITQNDGDATVKMKIFPSYAAAVDALVAGNVYFMRFGPATYILAKDRDDNICLLAMENSNNKKRFNGVFIVAKDSPINSIKDLKGKSFAFGNKNSTIGRYLSQAELVKVGLRSTDLANYDFLGRHDKVALAVSVGKYNAGAVK
jgi:phosphonate transport system substrate-binding protein